jgi:hypothetical protein
LPHGKIAIAAAMIVPYFRRIATAYGAATPFMALARQRLCAG